MRVLPTSEMGYLVIPVLLVVAVAYMWIVSKLVHVEQPESEQRRVGRAA